MVDDRISALWEDDGTTYGPVWSHSGWLGLRQIAHTSRCTYGHVKVWPLRAVTTGGLQPDPCCNA